MAVKRGVPGAELPALRQRRVKPAGRPDVDRARGHAGPVRRRHRQPGARRRRSGATGSSRASRWPTTPRCSTSGRRSWASGGCKRVARRRRPVVRGAGRDRGPAAAARLAGADAGRGDARGRRRLRLLPVRQRGRRPGRARTTTAQPSATGSPSRGSAATGTCAWPTSSGRGESGEVDVARLPAGHDGRRGSARSPRELFADDAYRDYLELHGLSVQLTEALAEYWHARIRAELGFAGEDPDDARGLLRPGLPRRALLVRLPRLPRPRGPRQDRRAARARSGSG